MKKCQSILLLSGFVPLVAAPIVIVASCSNDTTTSTTPSDTTTATKPTESKYTIVFNANRSFTVGSPIGQPPSPSFPDFVQWFINWLKNKVIEMKAEIFTAILGTLPTDETFWQNNLTIQNFFNTAYNNVKFNLKLTNASNVDGATEQQKTISAEITFISFDPKLSTVTLGL